MIFRDFLFLWIDIGCVSDLHWPWAALWILCDSYSGTLKGTMEAMWRHKKVVWYRDHRGQLFLTNAGRLSDQCWIRVAVWLLWHSQRRSRCHVETWTTVSRGDFSAPNDESQLPHWIDAIHDIPCKERSWNSWWLPSAPVPYSMFSKVALLLWFQLSLLCLPMLANKVWVKFRNPSISVRLSL